MNPRYEIPVKKLPQNWKSYVYELLYILSKKSGVFAFLLAAQLTFWCFRFFFSKYKLNCYPAPCTMYSIRSYIRTIIRTLYFGFDILDCFFTQQLFLVDIFCLVFGTYKSVYIKMGENVSPPLLLVLFVGNGQHYDIYGTA